MNTAKAKCLQESLTPCVSVRDIYHPLDTLHLQPLPRFGEAPTQKSQGPHIPPKEMRMSTFTFPASLAARAREHERGSANQILSLQTWHQKLACKAAGTPQTLFW